MAKQSHADVLNSYDPKIVKKLISKIDSCHADLESERGKYMQRCRSIRDTLSGVYDDCQAKGISKKSLKLFIKARDKYLDAIDMVGEQDIEERSTISMIASASGEDLPLFAFNGKAAGE